MPQTRPDLEEETQELQLFCFNFGIRLLRFRFGTFKFNVANDIPLFHSALSFGANLGAPGQ